MPPDLDSNMATGDADALSSSSISSPPTSPQNHDTIQVSRLPPPASNNSGEGVVNSTPGAPARSNNAATTTTVAAAATPNGTAPKKPKAAPRKKKEAPLGPDGKPIVEEKPKKPRKAPQPKDKAATGTTTAAPRKRVKTEHKTDDHVKIAASAPPQARQPTITEMVNPFQPQSQILSTPIASTPPPSSAQPQMSTQLRQSDGLSRTNLTLPISNPPTPRPISSGQNYDPIRGSTMMTAPPPSQASELHHISQQSSTARASPSIASLIDAPAPTIKANSHHPSYSPQPVGQHSVVSSQQPSAPSTPSKLAYTPLSAPPPRSLPEAVVASTMPASNDVTATLEVANRPVPEIQAPSKSSPSPTHTPKAARPTPEPPKGTGSGLLSSSDLFGGPGSAEPSERKGVNIDLHIALKPGGGNVINIAQEIIKKYGRDAINPRAAAHREQLLRIAAEQDKLGGASNDDMSVDNLSEMEGDSNVEMGGMDDEKSATGVDADGAKPVRKRKKKVEEYDKEDDFIDDTELAWQEQAAVAKDGFFVYSGPLVPEGQAPQVESSAPTRGTRGRGRGSRGGRTAGTGTTHASLAEKKVDPTTTTTTTRGRGRGGRGTGAPRKPRITKADKEKMESEKVDRERSAANITASTPAAASIVPSAAAPNPLAPPPTPMHPQQTHPGIAQTAVGSTA